MFVNEVDCSFVRSLLPSDVVADLIQVLSCCIDGSDYCGPPAIAGRTTYIFIGTICLNGCIHVYVCRLLDNQKGKP